MTKHEYHVIQIFVEDLIHEPHLRAFFRKVGEELAEVYDHDFDWRAFNILHYAATNRITVCYRDDKPVGCMFAQLYASVFDSRVSIYMQDSLWAEPHTRAIKYLYDDFIDFGKRNANHIITMTGRKTNLKPQTIERLGFKKLDTLYRMEKKNGKWR